MLLSDSVYQWLLNGPPWASYNALIHFGNEGQSSDAACRAYTRMSRHELIKDLVDELGQWPGTPIKRHNDAKLILHKLSFLADIGITAFNSDMEQLIDDIIKTSPDHGPLTVMGRIPKAFGGNDKDEMNWMMCDSPLLTSSLARIGFHDHPRVLESAKALLQIMNDKGCACASSISPGFHGPGKKGMECPYSSLLMLRLAHLYQDYVDMDKLKLSHALLLDQWTGRTKERPFLFGTGTDFNKLKAPLIWYDILHFTDAIRLFPGWISATDKKALSSFIMSKADEHGHFKAESVWQAWKKFDFGQKKGSSPWITFKVYHLLKAISEGRSKKQSNGLSAMGF